MEADFSGYATKAGLLCSDGRTILPEAFKHQDKITVPLVWQHGHTDPENVLGHVMLEARGDGMYAHAFFNGTPKAQHMKEAVAHKDIRMMSIWANNLVEKSKRVMHGVIREVSLVLSGANPGALIENVTIRHGDDVEIIDDEAIIYTGLEFQHADGSDDDDDGEESIQDIYDSMNDDQKTVLHYMVGEALAAAKDADNVDEAEHSNTTSDTAQHSNTTQEGTTDMATKTAHNVFEKKDTGEQNPHILSHDAIKSIMEDAKKPGNTLKSVLTDYCVQHGVENLDLLFPEAVALTAAPEWDKRRTEWVASVLGGANKTPFAKVKTWTANITYDEARAKGYIKGNLKKEEFFTISQRETGPQTVYKKQKLDRDDIIDITDFDIVAWIKGEMRLMLDEELGRAVLIGDGREVDDEDKIQEEKIRPIAKDNDYYVVDVPVNLGDASSTVLEVLDAIVMHRQYWKGSGQPTMFTTENFIARLLLLRDGDGHKLYRSLDEVKTELRIDAIVPVEVLENEPDIIAILVNMRDYTIGANRGGQVAMFDDFDIDYNQYKYLIETRISGALTKPKAAMVVRQTENADVQTAVTAPTWDPETWTVTIPVDAEVNYVDGAGNALADGAHVLDPGEQLRVVAKAAAGFYLEAGRNEWSYMRPTGSV